MSKPSILMIDDDESSLFVAENLLVNTFKLLTARNKKNGLSLLKEQHSQIKLVLLDLNMPDIKEFELLHLIRATYPHMPIIILSYVHNIQTVVEAMRAGANDFVTKEEASTVLLKRINQYILTNEPAKPSKTESDNTELYIPNHPAYRDIYDIALKFARNGLDFLIQSDTGTGKTALVNYIYKALKPAGLLVDINCGGIPESLAESEFFGHEAGSFTDAKNTSVGKFELANKGILFLDEIGNMPLTIQQKVLKAIEDKKITRVGSNREIQVDFLLIAATNEDLEKAVQSKRLRKDLYYRMGKPMLKLPSLNEYPEVIPEFIHFFVHQFNKKYNKQVILPPTLVQKLQNRHWDGNIRDLQKIIKIVIACYPDLSVIDYLLTGAETHTNTKTGGQPHLEDKLHHLKVSEITTALQKHHGNISQTAQSLGIKRTTLIHQIAKLGIDYKTFRNN